MKTGDIYHRGHGGRGGKRGNVNHERHESNTENEEIIKDKSADHCVERKYPLTHVFNFFRVL